MAKSIEIILRLIEWWFIDWHQKQAQQSRDSLSANPAGWFKQHFNRVRDETDASKTDGPRP